MKSFFAFWNELKVLHRIGDVTRRTINSGFCKKAVQELSGGPDEGTSEEIFLVAGLLAHDHDLGIGRAFAENGSSRRLVEWAGLAASGQLAKSLKRLANVFIGIENDLFFLRGEVAKMS